MSKPTHYPLTMDEFLKLNALLTDAELRVYLYLMIKNPFPDSRIEIDTAFISEQLGLTRRTVQRSIKRLSELQLIEIEITQFKYKKAIHGASSKLGGAVNDDTRIANDDIRIASGDTKIVFSDTRIANDDTRIASTPPKLSPSKAFDSSHTIKTYSDLIKTLSEGEREKFLSFSLEKCKSLPKLPELPMKWIEAHWEELYAQFKSTPEAVAAAVTNIDWTQHSNWEEWLQEMREGVPRFVALGTCFDRKMRRAIADWADERGMIWGNES